ncbi:hypothetical protein BAU15_07970 [Enterococcus sp. JM4C]|uniref:DUF916 and DUF3324 domain-containing protein n=1 Tax=Candidatus Enterococcus huntleyi TaxID=1857217 RepID=UPI00137B02BD|nr:DUF916 and DUF3324 domain-containing protein [Enterococcus sp. JM4C]KAF1297832.1 hypothetical protein BAU15_07970 [Enterococcus sp. JM4C]
MKKKILMIVMIACGLFLVPSVAYGVGEEKAAETASSTEGQSPAGFEYQVMHPENQISESGGLDLKMTPGQKQTVKIKIKNTSDKPMTLSLELNSTKTNSAGVLEWGPSLVEKDASLKYDFVDIVKVPAEITVPAKSEEEIPVEITMPDVAYDGVIAGGIRMISKDQGEVDPNATIINRYANLIGVLLKESSTPVVPELKMNKVYAGLSNYRGSIFINYSNINAIFVADMSVEAQIFGKDSDEVLYDKKQSGMNMAPNSQITIPVSMEGDEMKAGDYRAKVVATIGEKKWEWTEEFTITKEEADKFNQEDVGVIQERGIDWTLIAMIVGAGVVVAVGLFVGIRLMNKKKQQKLAEARKRQRKAQKSASKKETGNGKKRPTRSTKEPEEK